MSILSVRKKIMTDEQFISNVQAIIRITGWPQAKLARFLGLDPATITKWLKKERSPDGTARYAINDLLRRAKEGEFAVPTTASA